MVSCSTKIMAFFFFLVPYKKFALMVAKCFQMYFFFTHIILSSTHIIIFIIRGSEGQRS